MDERPGQSRTPISLAVVSSVLGVLVALLVTGAIFLNYVLMVHYIHGLQEQQRRQGIPVCKALKEVARAKNGATLFGGEYNPNSYINRLSAGMTQLYITTGCEKITGPL